MLSWTCSVQSKLGIQPNLYPGHSGPNCGAQDQASLWQIRLHQLNAEPGLTAHFWGGSPFPVLRPALVLPLDNR